MSKLIKNKTDIDALAAGLRARGWTPCIGQVSYDSMVAGYTIGVIVKIGDERMAWTAHRRNPMIDFFSIANVANGTSKTLARKPVGFNWGMAGVDTIQINPNNDEKVADFVERLSKLASLHNVVKAGAQPGLFDMLEVPVSASDAVQASVSAPISSPARSGMRM